MKLNNIQLSAILITLSTVITSCSLDDDGKEKEIISPEPRYEASIARTQFNVAHIEASDFGSLGFGQGYAGAQDGLCILADQIIKIKSERAKYHGAGDLNVHIASDIAYKALKIIERATVQFENLSANSQELVKGYSAGYNKFIQTTAADQLPAACAGEKWVKEISHIDLFAYHIDIASALGAKNFVALIAGAMPPSTSSQQGIFPPASALPDFRNLNLGSNGLALGKDKTESGKGLLLANPHLPWFGEFTYTEQHLTIPGELDIAGSQVLGVPMLGIGFGEFGAQTVTVSTAIQYTAYRLTLSPSSPTKYLYDGEVRDMTVSDISIDVLQDDGSLALFEHKIYESHYGPMIAMPVVGEWTTASAMTIRFPSNASSPLDSYMQTMIAKSNEELKSILKEVGGSPFLNYIRVSPEGEVFFIDAAPVPNLSADAIAKFFGQLKDDPVAAYLFSANGMVLLNGSDSTFEWVDDPRANQPGTVPFDLAPKYEGSDYALHTNDSPWLINANNPNNAFSPLYGATQQARQPRNRWGHSMVDKLAGEDGLFNNLELVALQFSNQGQVAALIKDDLAAHCLLDPTFTLDSEVIDLLQACTVLANWDGTYNLDSVGAPIFREFISGYSASQVSNGDGLFAVAFDPLDPINTPNTLLIATGSRSEDSHLRNLAIAVKRLNAINIPLNAPLSSWQFTDRTGQKFAVHGGNSTHDGVWNMASYSPLLNTSLVQPNEVYDFSNPATGLKNNGYIANMGSSYIMTVSYDEGVPVGKSLLFYGQSRDPNSTHFSDQMELYANKQLKPVHFNSTDVEANTVEKIRVTDLD